MGVLYVPHSNLYVLELVDTALHQSPSANDSISGYGKMRRGSMLDPLAIRHKKYWMQSHEIQFIKIGKQKGDCLFQQP